jgi:hypothetical protein
MGVTPQIGLPIEVAVWLTGRETGQQLDAWKKDCRAEVGKFGLENGVVMSEAAFTEKLPGEDRVPPVPDHISGPGVRLLVCEATVVASLKADIVRSTGFVHDLDAKDLARLRRITRAAHQKAQPMERTLTDAECDAVIEQIGPQSALATVREGVDRKVLN